MSVSLSRQIDITKTTQPVINMTSVSTTVVEVTKNINDTVIMPHDSQCQNCNVNP